MNWETIQAEALNHFQNLIRINTTNPPGNEIEAVKYISALLQKEGIPHEIFEPAPGRASLIARITGTGAKKPLLLTSHLDVVPVEAEKWSHPPFSGEIHDGCVWGRGAVDMKQMAAMSLMMLLTAKRNGVRLSRDLIFAAVADEEAGCQWGSQWLVENKPQLLDAEYALNEVGGFCVTIGEHRLYPIGVAEKGICWFKITVEGDPGHGSIPHDNQAVVKMSGAVSRIGEKTMPFHQTAIACRFVNQLAKHEKSLRSLVLKGLTLKLFNRFILEKIFPDKRKARSFHALFHNTMSPTVFKAGSKINVIPSTAELSIDGRILPGETVESFIEEARQIIGPGFGLEILRSWKPLEVPHDNPFFDLLAQSLKANDSQAVAVPYLMPGFTDAAHYNRLGIKTYGFAPVRLPPGMDFSSLFHGHNERIPVDGFYFGLKVLWDVVRNA
ncbi:MAG: M20/M25/M40 family metallo-hydrolase [Deltaproteobacteria bacterium]|nr:M20/M25/M40 family metallo-hydrolase [Deltaproteobacteria bacterium]